MELHHHNLLLLLLLLLLILLNSASFKISSAEQEEFARCMSIHSSSGYIEAFKYLYAPSSPSYPILLQSFQQNPRWLNSTSSKPAFVVTPYTEKEIQAAVVCSKKHDLQIRVKSGGHDYEGLSFLCHFPFIIIDLTNLRSISIDLEEETAWVQSGATVGELYYSIAMKSNLLGFPAGICPSVGVGGHFSGGGFGTMLRKYGLAADNIIDAYFIDVNARVLDRETMGEDLFWAIRGGGGASFGIVIAWKIKLVPVPPVVTVFTLHRNLDQEGIHLVNRWQNVSSTLPQDLFIRLVLQNSNRGDNSDHATAEVLFNSLFLGPLKELMGLMDKNFPELGLESKECKEMSWIESTLYHQGFKSGDPLEVLLDRTVQDKSYFKAKSDFVEEPIGDKVWEAIRGRISEERIGMLILDPFGGRMDAIPESEVPFPHRKGNLYNIQYLVKWEGESETHISWIRALYDYMEPYVASSPRSAYLNYRDLDIGINNEQNYSEAAVWGRKYFKGNFQMLSEVKSKIDPGNFFRSEQTVPPLYNQGKFSNY